MNRIRVSPTETIFTAIAFIVASCGVTDFDNVTVTEAIPAISPDYTGVTIPPNIAPMNFLINEEADYFRVEVTSSAGEKLSISSRNGIVRFPERKWRKITGSSPGGDIQLKVFAYDREEQKMRSFLPFYMYIAEEPIDPYLVYRKIHPGYYSWYRMKIVQRSTESFREESIVENQLLDHNCINCHSFNRNDPETFLLHVRGSRGGTYFAGENGLIKKELRIDGMPANATYPSWHPSGKYVAFSANAVRQSFYAHSDNNIEVFDLESSLVLYDVENNSISQPGDADAVEYMQTFPDWSPEGGYLYYSRTRKPDFEIDAENIKTIGYDIARRPFDPATGLFGEPEIVFDASGLNKSASFAKVSPDGRHLVFTLHDCGTFPVWSSEAELCLLDLQSGEFSKPDIGSDDTESYHGWSSNGKWLVFSSKRKDGVSSRPYFSYFGSLSKPGKPFVLPQKDPSLYDWMLKSFNLPELVTGEVSIGPRDFERASEKESLRALPVENMVTPAE